MSALRNFWENVLGMGCDRKRCDREHYYQFGFGGMVVRYHRPSGDQENPR